MDKINHCINHNRFIPIDAEELTALELIGKGTEKTNELVDKSNDHEERIINNEKKKVSFDDMKEKYKFDNNFSDIDYRGKWFGLDEPTLSDEGMRSQVQKNSDDILKHSEQLEDIPNFLTELKLQTVYGLKQNGTPMENRIALQKALDNEKFLCLPQRIIEIDDTLIKEGSIKISSNGIAPSYGGLKEENRSGLKISGDKTVLIINNGEGTYLQNVCFKNTSSTKDVVQLNNSVHSKIDNCGFYGGRYALSLINSGVSSVLNSQFCNATNSGLNMVDSGDSNLHNNYFNTNNYDYNGSEILIGNGLTIQRSNNINISGGKIEWNNKGIVVVQTNGVNINNIQFDYNREIHVALVQFQSTSDEVFALKSININGNRFLGTTTFGKSCHLLIDTYDNCRVNVTGNSFNSSGPKAYDDNGASTTIPLHDKAPNTLVRIINRGVNTCDVDILSNKLINCAIINTHWVDNLSTGIVNLNFSKYKELGLKSYLNKPNGGKININETDDYIPMTETIIRNGVTFTIVRTKHFIEIGLSGIATNTITGDIMPVTPSLLTTNRNKSVWVNGDNFINLKNYNAFQTLIANGSNVNGVNIVASIY